MLSVDIRSWRDSWRIGDVRQRGGISGVASGGHRSGRLRCDREGLVLDRRRDQLGHAFDLHVAVLELPLVVGLQQHRAHQPGDALLVGELRAKLSTRPRRRGA